MRKGVHNALRRKLVGGAIGLGGVGYAARKIYLLGAPPEGPKPCELTYPFPAAPGPPPSAEPHFALVQRRGTINDASCLNRTPVLGIAAPASFDEIRSALTYARSQGVRVTAAGARHSMGGQAFSRGGLVVDMRRLNGISVDVPNKVVTVGAGATWDAMLHVLDAHGLAVKAMQSISIFTVGGTLSVNAHGLAHSPGSVAATVRSLRLMLSDGTIATASPTENRELFRHVLGGYGLFGIILEAQLEVTDNELYSASADTMDYRDFPAYFARQVQGVAGIGLMYGRLSMAPSSWLRETVVHIYRRIAGPESCPPLGPDLHTRLERTIFNFSKSGGFGRWVRWNAERRFDPLLQCQSRNAAIGTDPACALSRNEAMDDQMGYLMNRLDDTDILQEYFVPRRRFLDFVDGLRRIVSREGANLLNATIRSVEADTLTSLPYAPEDAFALVLYFNQALSIDACRVLERTTSALIDLAIDVGGRFYLPYQLYYSPAQLNAAYPETQAFFAARKRYDAAGILSNTFSEKYARTNL